MFLPCAFGREMPLFYLFNSNILYFVGLRLWFKPLSIMMVLNKDHKKVHILQLYENLAFKGHLIILGIKTVYHRLL